MSESETPTELLQEIQELLSESNTFSADGLAPEPRYVPEEGSNQYEILSVLLEDDWLNSKEIDERSNVDINGLTRALTQLYRGFVINRRRVNGVFEYQVRDLELLSEKKSSEQTTIHPWDSADVGRGKWNVIRLIDEKTNPTSVDIESGLKDVDGISNNSGRPILTELFRDGYVNRTPDAPHVYFLTDEGKAQLE